MFIMVVYGKYFERDVTKSTHKTNIMFSKDKSFGLFKFVKTTMTFSEMINKLDAIIYFQLKNIQFRVRL